MDEIQTKPLELNKQQFEELRIKSFRKGKIKNEQFSDYERSTSSD